jgi:glycine/D-amino acid oxidase-like deaminating enzyme
MKAQARVAVVGGGVVGASVLYHLAKAGWTDAVLIERDELASGSTWRLRLLTFPRRSPNTPTVLKSKSAESADPRAGPALYDPSGQRMRAL